MLQAYGLTSVCQTYGTVGREVGNEGPLEPRLHFEKVRTEGQLAFSLSLSLTHTHTHTHTHACSNYSRL